MGVGRWEREGGFMFHWNLTHSHSIYKSKHALNALKEWLNLELNVVGVFVGVVNVGLITFDLQHLVHCLKKVLEFCFVG